MRCHLLRYHSVTLRYITLRGKAEWNLCLPGLPGPGPSEAAVINANAGLEVLGLFKVKPEGQTIRYPDNSPPRQFAPDMRSLRSWREWVRARTFLRQSR